MSNVSSSSAVTSESVHVFVFSMLILIESSLARRQCEYGGGERISSSDCAAATRPFARRKLGARLPPPQLRLSEAPPPPPIPTPPPPTAWPPPVTVPSAPPSLKQKQRIELMNWFRRSTCLRSYTLEGLKILWK